MRRVINILVLTVALLGIVAFEAQAQVKLSLSGRTLSKSNEAIAYATVVLTTEGRQVAGGATNANGEFTLTAPSGTYLFSARYVGYKRVERQIGLD